MKEKIQLREQEYFDKLAESKNEIWWGNKTVAGRIRKERRADLLVEFLNDFKNPKILEIGCGTGFSSHIFLKKLKSVKYTGIDISPKSVKIARKKCKNFKNANFEVGDITSLKYKSNTFNAVIGVSILHHIPLIQGLKEIIRIIKHNGVIWFSEPNMMNLEIFLQKKIRFLGKLLENSEDETAFYRHKLKKTLLKIGFINVMVKPFDFLHPLIPPSLINIASRIGEIIEKVPVLKEISGSLLITGQKP